MKIRIRIVLVHHHVSVRRRRLLVSFENHRSVSDLMRELISKFDRYSSHFCHAAMDGFSLPLDEMVDRVVADYECLKIHLYVTAPADFEPAIHLSIAPLTSAAPYHAFSAVDIDSAWEKISAGDSITFRLKVPSDDSSWSIAEAQVVSGSGISTPHFINRM